MRFNRLIPSLGLSLAVAVTPAHAADRSRHASAKNFSISIDDYPADARQRDERGRTAFTFAVNEKGRVENCEITAPSGSASLDRQSCVIATRTQFQPARDVAGKPVRERWSWAIAWTDPQKRDIHVEPPQPLGE